MNLPVSIAPNSRASIAMLMSDPLVADIFRRRCVECVNGGELSVSIRKNESLNESVYRVMLDDTCIIEAEVFLGRVVRWSDPSEIAGRSKLLGLNQGLNRFPGMWKGEVA